MRDGSLFDKLQKELDKVPLMQRRNAAFSFDLMEKETVRNHEVIYQNVVSRLARLAYYLEWARNLENNKIKPSSDGKLNEHAFHISFHDFKQYKEKDVLALNNFFSGWVSHQVVRDLSEFLMYYLLGVYETCLAIRYSRKSIKPAEIVEGRLASKKFEGNGIKDRLKVLRQEFGFEIQYPQELIRLYNIRNIFAHFDGVVHEEFCKENGKLKVLWPVNTYKLKKRHRDEFVPYDEVPKPFDGDEYSALQITWLNKSKILFYAAGDKISLTHKETNDLLFFYLYIFNQFHSFLESFARSHDVKVKPFSEYILKFQISALADNGEVALLDVGQDSIQPI